MSRMTAHLHMRPDTEIVAELYPDENRGVLEVGDLAIFLADVDQVDEMVAALLRIRETIEGPMQRATAKIAPTGPFVVAREE